jgi:hypothetical protein
MQFSLREKVRSSSLLFRQKKYNTIEVHFCEKITSNTEGYFSFLAAVT